MICENCGKRQAVFQTHQLIDGRPSIIYLCEVCAEEFQSGGRRQTSFLDQYGRDITELARQGKLDPVIGRQAEIERVIHILSRRTKNNPVLIGDPGVGKTAIVEGLAQRVVDETVPEALRGKRIVSLDLALMLAGASHRGEFEERLKKTLEEVTKAKGEIIIFIDEMHTIVGAGAAQGAIDASNMLKPALARGELQCVGATTLDEYRRHVEKDGALERRFQPIMVSEPTRDESLEILKGLRPRYEEHHRVRVSDEALKAAVELSDRFISDRFLPDKAIDLVDEACAKKRLETAVPAAAGQVSQVSRELERLQDKPRKTLAEMEKIEELSNLYSRRLEGAAAPAAVESIPQVSDQDIAKVVASITGIPVEDISEDERQRLTKLEQRLHERIVGQDEAVSAVSAAIRRARAGLKDPGRPIGSFIFLGPTGVGKTELAKALAEALWGDENLMIRLDMSEYGERHTVSRLVGSPPGYVGYEEGGQLTEVVRRKPFSVILFDEIEKAHPDVFNILLQILEDGRLTDAHGKKVDFKNTVVILTSNVGTSLISQARVGFGGAGEKRRSFEEIKDELMTNLQKSFRPEFLNRIDEVVVFHPLTEAEVRKITDLLVERSAKLMASQEIKLEVSPKARNFLAKRGFDPDLGARPLRRLIQREIENPVSNAVVSGEYKEGSAVMVDLVGDKLTFQLLKKRVSIKV
ncbi:MAG: AAA family ATPase [Patescibacteria group bacterium]